MQRRTGIDPTPTEILAIQHAQYFHQLIQKIHEPNGITERDLLAFDRKQHEVQAFLNEVQKIELAQDHEEVKSYYFLYLLQQLSRFNQYFNQVRTINDQRPPIEDLKTQIMPWSIDPAFTRGMTPISHYLLTPPTTMDITIQRGNVFRDVVVDANQGEVKRYHYHPKPEGHIGEHPDAAHYIEANTRIFAATQSSNLSRAIKGAAKSVVGLFKAGAVGQGVDDYFKPIDYEMHAIEKALFKSGWYKIKHAQPLTADEVRVLSDGQYYRHACPVKFKLSNSAKSKETLNAQITHIGHASEYIAIEDLRLVIDPVHFQSGTSGLIRVAGKFFYDRKTAPAFDTDNYPGLNIGLISHNHHDHMCLESIKKICGQSNTLFIVPVGDAKYMQECGITNFIEIGSWNDIVNIELTTKNKQSSYQIRPLPAKHASNRGAYDLYQSLYMGYMIRDMSKNHVILCTGDTAVLDNEHFEQLEEYLLMNQLTISTACIAHGPDRPRKWMECTHQSTADAITMHARFNIMNAKVLAEKFKSPLSIELLNQAACYGIGYHQGCYRLGLLSLSDVDTTLLRMFAVLKSLGDKPINQIGEFLLESSLLYHFMDEFEKTGLRETLAVYESTGPDFYLTAKEVLKLITSHLTIPQPGARADFSQPIPYQPFEFNFERLLLNREHPSQMGKMGESAMKYFVTRIDPEDYSEGFNRKQLVEKILTLYLARDSNALKGRVKKVRQFIGKLNTVADNNLENVLSKFYQEAFPKQDEGIRDEGHLHTAMTLIAGFIYDSDFPIKINRCRYDYRILKLNRQLMADNAQQVELVHDVELIEEEPAAAPSKGWK